MFHDCKIWIDNIDQFNTIKEFLENKGIRIYYSNLNNGYLRIKNNHSYYSYLDKNKQSTKDFADRFQPNDPWYEASDFIQRFIKGKYMKIGKHKVTDINNNSAKVGCITVTREEVEILLREMNNVPKYEVGKKYKLIDGSYLMQILDTIRNTSPCLNGKPIVEIISIGSEYPTHTPCGGWDESKNDVFVKCGNDYYFTQLRFLRPLQ